LSEDLISCVTDRLNFSGTKSVHKKL
jgi:hypothetical protein